MIKICEYNKIVTDFIQRKKDVLDYCSCYELVKESNGTISIYLYPIGKIEEHKFLYEDIESNDIENEIETFLKKAFIGQGKHCRKLNSEEIRKLNIKFGFITI